MRGRKQHRFRKGILSPLHRIKKESPNEGTETRFMDHFFVMIQISYKKESPNEGTETNIGQS